MNYKKPVYAELPLKCPRCNYGGPFKIIPNSDYVQCPKCRQDFLKNKFSAFDVDIEVDEDEEKEEYKI